MRISHLNNYKLFDLVKKKFTNLRKALVIAESDKK